MRVAKLTVLFVLVFGYSVIRAAVPKLINFQGILKTSGGSPVADGSYSVVFTIYDAAVGGSAFWADSQSVTTSNGLFTVLLGANNPLPDSVFNDTSRYLGIKVASDPEMAPRPRLVTVPYVYRSTLTQMVFPRGVQEYASPGTFTFTVPAGVTLIHVEVWGAGGGGGGGSYSGGGGGGAGAYSRTIFPVASGQTFTVNVGTGGSGGTPGVAGSNGDSSSFETFSGTILLRSGGGNGGQPGIGSCPQPGGAGGMGGVADPNALLKRNGTNGSSGERSWSSGGTFSYCIGGLIGGDGGLAPLGTISPPGVIGGSGGGSGCQTGCPPAASGGSGGNGYVLIQW